MNIRLSYVVDGDKRCIGHLLERGVTGFEAFDRDEKSLGVFPTTQDAAAAIIKPVAEVH